MMELNLTCACQATISSHSMGSPSDNSPILHAVTYPQLGLETAWELSRLSRSPGSGDSGPVLRTARCGEGGGGGVRVRARVSPCIGRRGDGMHPVCRVCRVWSAAAAFPVCFWTFNPHPCHNLYCKTQHSNIHSWVAISSFVVCPASVISTLISTIWCFRP